MPTPTKPCHLRAALLLGAALLPNSASSSGLADETKHPAADSGEYPALHVSKKSLASLNQGRELGLEVNAGVIPRAQLRAELSRGIARFLGEVRAEPAFTSGRFAGWRIVELYRRRPEINVQVLRPGDLVLRVNGEPVERPEQLKQVWDKLGHADQLVMEILRNGQPSKLRYTIAD